MGPRAGLDGCSEEKIFLSAQVFELLTTQPVACPIPTTLGRSIFIVTYYIHVCAVRAQCSALMVKLIDELFVKGC